MRIEQINGQYRILPGTPGSARDSTPSAKPVAPLAPSMPAPRPVEEDRIEIQGQTIGRAVDTDRVELSHRGGVDEELIAGRVDENVDLGGAGERNGLLDRTYFVQGPQLAAFNAARIGSAVDVHV